VLHRLKLAVSFRRQVIHAGEPMSANRFVRSSQRRSFTGRCVQSAEFTVVPLHFSFSVRVRCTLHVHGTSLRLASCRVDDGRWVRCDAVVRWFGPPSAVAHRPTATSSHTAEHSKERRERAIERAIGGR
jgi:hypothetical protein